MLDGLSRNARILWRAESIVADIRLRHLLKRSVLTSGAGLAAILGLVMLNVAGFLYLEPTYGGAGAAGLVSLLDFAVSAAGLVAAALAKPGRELDLALEIRQSALDGIERDAQSLQAALTALRADISAAMGMLRHPLDAALPGLIVPLAGLLIKGMTKPEHPPEKS